MYISRSFALLVGMVGLEVMATAVVQPVDYSDHDEKDFLFLAAEEPDTQEIVYDEQTEFPSDEEVIVKTPKRVKVIPTCHEKTIKALEQISIAVPKKQPFPVYEKIEDRESLQLITQNFAFKKKFGELMLSCRYRPELFYGCNITSLNDYHDLDRIVFLRHTIDITGEAKAGQQENNFDALYLKFTLRNKGVWGNPASILPTTDASVKLVDALIGPHRHTIGRHVVWIRELWLKTSWNEIFNSKRDGKHYIIIGFYPFKLGHGIALGDAYAVNPGLLGFYTDNVVDQYAPGILFTGDIVKDVLKYDLYWAWLENKSDSLSNNAEPIYFQRFGKRHNPQRGFGSANWLVAGRLQAVPFDSKKLGKLNVEPYFLFNHAPEQRIEFSADSKADISTLGLSMDYERGNFGASFEVAGNLGKRTAWGWDRNQVVPELITTAPGGIRLVNNHVIDTTTNSKALDTPANQKAINNAPQDEAYNGQLIAGTTLQNTNDRFSNEFSQHFKGAMVFFDTGYWFWNKQVQLAGTVGYASGDENPNESFTNPRLAPTDTTYEGFVGLQEIFTGGRVESAFLLGQRRLVRPLSLPEDALSQGFFAASLAEFTNLVFTGLALHVKPSGVGKLLWRQNLLFFWQPVATHAFDLATKTVFSHKFARSFLGTEINSFVDFFPLEQLKAFVIFSLFIPGSHFTDIKGTPLSREQVNIINNDAGQNLGKLPLLGTDCAYTLNVGIEYKF
jgi:hypothetical protein